eukprot:CAMPEP_0118891012 /NCGR_PEP_ID=MMETSP1166-20130328/1209_1 /TAXON_ID=1104430 /ORGANISM="Chrysoreinhardia sp, Strain CCMP3193" /LENGTH=109 /DNA_ID=CAMNT_0006829645 /DNA_START=105 /DNA_END=435 /DNA_ORIENTATION=-
MTWSTWSGSPSTLRSSTMRERAVAAWALAKPFSRRVPGVVLVEDHHRLLEGLEPLRVLPSAAAPPVLSHRFEECVSSHANIRKGPGRVGSPPGVEFADSEDSEARDRAE